jgi:hypothetical protein
MALPSTGRETKLVCCDDADDTSTPSATHQDWRVTLPLAPDLSLGNPGLGLADVLAGLGAFHGFVPGRLRHIRGGESVERGGIDGEDAKFRSVRNLKGFRDLHVTMRRVLRPPELH